MSSVARFIDIVLLLFFCRQEGEHNDRNGMENETNHMLRNPLLATDVGDEQREAPHQANVVEQRDVLQPHTAIEQNGTNGQQIVPPENEQKSEKKDDHSRPSHPGNTDASLGNVMDVQRKALQRHAVQQNGSNGQELVPQENEQNERDDERSSPSLPTHTDTSPGINVQLKPTEVERKFLLPHIKQMIELADVHAEALSDADPSFRSGVEKTDLDGSQEKLLPHINQLTQPADGHSDPQLHEDECSSPE